MKRHYYYKLEFIWLNGCKDNVLCTSSTMALMIVRELFEHSMISDILIYDLNGEYQYLKHNFKATYYYQNLFKL